MKEELKEIFNTLKKLKIDATPENVSILMGVFTLLKAMYNKLKSEEEDGNGRPEADPE